MDILEQKAKALEIMDDMLSYTDKYVKLLQHGEHFKSVAKVVQSNGITRSGVLYLKNTIVGEVLSDTNLLDYRKYDYDPKNNVELSKELSSLLDKTGSSTSTIKELIAELRIRFDEYNTILMETNSVLTNQLSSAKKELSNTSKEVIPAKAKDYENISLLPKEFLCGAALVDTTKVTRENILAHLNGCVIDEVKTPFLSENIVELRQTLLLNKKQFVDGITRVLTSLNLFIFYRKCS